MARKAFGYILCYEDCASQFIPIILSLTTFLVGSDRITFEFKRPFSHFQFLEAVLGDKQKGRESGSREIRRLDANISTHTLLRVYVSL